MEKLRGIHEVLSEEEVSRFLSETYPDMNQAIEFEPFLKVQWANQACLEVILTFTYSLERILFNNAVLGFIRSI